VGHVVHVGKGRCDKPAFKFHGTTIVCRAWPGKGALCVITLNNDV
jgi:hypothetical protein